MALSPGAWERSREFHSLLLSFLSIENRNTKYSYEVKEAVSWLADFIKEIINRIFQPIVDGIKRAIATWKENVAENVKNRRW